MPLGEPVGDNERELSGEVLGDGWILDVKELSWTKVGAIAQQIGSDHNNLLFL